CRGAPRGCPVPHARRHLVGAVSRFGTRRGSSEVLGISRIQDVRQPSLEAVEVRWLDATFLVGPVTRLVRAVHAIWSEQARRGVAEGGECCARSDDLVVSVPDDFG